MFVHIFHMVSQRWENAQQAEKNYWKSRENWINDIRINDNYWAEMLRYGYDLNYDFFEGKDVLEIGCGPAGIIFSLKNVKTRIGIEPMNLNEFIKENWKKEIVREGMGENLPIGSDSCDIVISFNALDHCSDPEAVISEINRVLRSGGEFLLWIHVLRGWCKFLKSILNRLDSPHPYHFTANEILSLTSGQFQIKTKRIFEGLGPSGYSENLPAKKNVKVLIGNWLMNDMWLRLGKLSN